MHRHDPRTAHSHGWGGGIGGMISPSPSGGGGGIGGMISLDGGMHRRDDLSPVAARRRHRRRHRRDDPALLAVRRRHRRDDLASPHGGGIGGGIGGMASPSGGGGGIGGMISPSSSRGGGIGGIAAPAPHSSSG
ncbi:hypothetical protein BE20_13865 [Sorangium cellulosum]|nr:hypothetical protein BE20_13865 [Sorangium cellulosum]